MNRAENLRQLSKGIDEGLTIVHYLKEEINDSQRLEALEAVLTNISRRVSEMKNIEGDINADAGEEDLAKTSGFHCPNCGVKLKVEISK